LFDSCTFITRSKARATAITRSAHTLLAPHQTHQTSSQSSSHKSANPISFPLFISFMFEKRYVMDDEVRIRFDGEKKGKIGKYYVFAFQKVRH
jgi:hypothetical protein